MPANHKLARDTSGKGQSLLAVVDDYIVVDLETTGLGPETDAIIEIAAVQVSCGEVIATFERLVNPGRLIDGFIQQFTGITNDMLCAAPPIRDVLPKFAVFAGGSVMVAHNANFDINFLNNSFRRHLGHPFSNDFIDTMRLSRRLFGQYRHHRLADLIDRFNVGEAVAHRALSDAVQTYKCYEHMKAHMQENGIDPNSLYAKPKRKERV
jgi:DNA polymerase-3 subunit epsilon